MLIDSNGDKKGMMPISEALEIAKDQSLDLMQVSSPDANPVVCKILDYGKTHIRKEKSISSSKTKTKRTTVKEIKFRPSTDRGDYEIKLKRLKALFLGEIRLK